MIPTEELRVDACVSGQNAGLQGVKDVDECPFSNEVYKFWWTMGAGMGIVHRAGEIKVLGLLEKAEERFDSIAHRNGVLESALAMVQDPL